MSVPKRKGTYMTLRQTILRRIGGIDAQIRSIEKETAEMRQHPHYLACMKAWKQGIGWYSPYTYEDGETHDLTEEDCKEWWDQLDNQKAMIDDCLHRKAELEDLLNVPTGKTA